jgi:hypothetical protein
MAIRSLAAALVIALGVDAASAQIDVSGRWHLMMESGFGPFERSLSIVQSGSVLAVSQPSPYTGGTIDPATGAFRIDGSGQCCDFFGSGGCVTVAWFIDGVAAADGATFTGTYEESVQPTRSCLTLSGTILGERLVDTCGNGVVDTGEQCDVGVAGGACCTAFCTFEPADRFCGSSGDPCSSGGRCDGAGTCVQQPNAAGTLCRFPAFPCDTAEFCDGTSAVCPAPTSPTEPDGDGDGILDGCDPCTAQPLEKVHLRAGRFGAPDARDVFSLRAQVRLPPGALLPDPTRPGGKIISVRDATGALLRFTYVSGMPWDPVLRYGWRQKGQRWLFRSFSEGVADMSRVRLSMVPDQPGLWDLRLDSHAALRDAPPVLPLTLIVTMDGDDTSTLCGEIRLSTTDGSPRCAPITRKGMLVCR